MVRRKVMRDWEEVEKDKEGGGRGWIKVGEEVES